MNLEPIDTSTTAGKARVMQLAAEGRRVAARRKIRITDEWWEPGEADWNWSDIEFAIFAEPAGLDEVWIVHHKDGDQSLMSGKDDADQWVSNAAGDKAVRYIRADLAGEVGA